MRWRLLLLLAVLVSLPLGLLTYLGVRLAREEQQAVLARLEELLGDDLRGTAALLEGVVQQRERELLMLLGDPAPTTAGLRELAWRSALVGSPFLLGPDCGRRYPPLEGPLTAAERRFIGQAEPFWADLLALCRPPAAGPVEGPAAPPASSAGLRTHGWYQWSWGGGVELLFWRRLPGGGLLGVEVNGIRLLADLVAALPAERPGQELPRQTRVALQDARGEVLYQWGGLPPPPGEAPLTTLPLAAPLEAWQLVGYLPRAEVAQTLGGGIRFSLLATLILAGLGLLFVAGLFYRSHARALAEAAQQVSFVNRVSHELKTPLTNIRLYAELLAETLSEEEAPAHRRLQVIVAESRRLSRLIDNILTFSRQQRGKLSLRLAPGRLDEVLGAVLEVFRPALADREVTICFRPGAPDLVLLDPDVVEQVLGNLVVNVEKYAAEGRLLLVESWQRDGRSGFVVEDRGPGIPAALQERIFEPFFRLSSRPSDLGTGTGLGLGIARELVRLHGGELRLLPGEPGCRFAVELATPAVGGGEAA